MNLGEKRDRVLLTLLFTVIAFMSYLIGWRDRGARRG